MAQAHDDQDFGSNFWAQLELSFPIVCSFRKCTDSVSVRSPATVATTNGIHLTSGTYSIDDFLPLDHLAVDHRSLLWSSSRERPLSLAVEFGS